MVRVAALPFPTRGIRRFYLSLALRWDDICTINSRFALFRHLVSLELNRRGSRVRPLPSGLEWVLMTIALRTAHIYPSILALWINAALVQAGVGIVALWWMPLGPIASVITWAIGIALFLRLTAYNVSELKLLARAFLPGLSPVPDRGSEVSALREPKVRSAAST